MNLFEQLKQDHKTLINLIDQLLRTDPSQSDEWQRKVQDIRDELIPHSRAEEAILYNALRDLDYAKDLVRHSYREHAMAEATLRSLQVASAVDIEWKSGVEKLKESLSHHISEEEGPVFQTAQKLFSEEEALRMGQAFQEMKPAIRSKSFFGTTLDMIVNMLPERLRGSVSKFNAEDIPSKMSVEEGESKAS